MSYWWEASPEERYWCEITDREDIGADLKCPQANEAGRDYWSYSLIRSVQPGDIVFHYSTTGRAYVGASVAGGPVESRAIVWAPHGTVGRAKEEPRQARPGWWLPLYGFKISANPLTLAELHAPDEQAWIREWLAKMERHGTVAAPIFPYRPGELRAMQGYLTKMPSDFIKRWEKLSSLVAELEGIAGRLEPLAEVVPALAEPALVFEPKSAADYVAVLKGGQQRKTRSHEALVKFAAETLQASGAVVANPHPIDLLVASPIKIIIEAKTTRGRAAGFAIREAVGQLYEYRYFIGPQSARLCILLDAAPESDFLTYVENVLGLMVLWRAEPRLVAGPATQTVFAAAGLRFPIGA